MFKISLMFIKSSNKLLGQIALQKALQYCLLLSMLFLTVGCTCSCEYTVPEISSNYTTSNANVIVFADGCGNADGSVNSDGIPLSTCGTPNTNNYNSRGRWVKLPTISAPANSTLNVDIYGSVYYCSSGYDNQNPSPTFSVCPGAPRTTLFDDGSEMVVTPGQMILLKDTDAGVVIGNNGPNSVCSINGTGYTNFSNGTCRGTNALGLTIYVNGSELVTLDATNTATGSGTVSGTNISGNSLQYSITRTPDLFASTSILPAAGQNSSNFNDVLSSYNTRYQSLLTQNSGAGRYLFVVPEGVKGKLGFSIAKEKNSSSSTGGACGSNKCGSRNCVTGNSFPASCVAGSCGSGQYTLQVLSTPSACFVDESMAMGHPGQRGALQMLVSNSNPNNFDNAINAFNNLAVNEISIYYPQLRNYIASTAGIVLDNNAAILSDLVTPKIASLSPIVINGSNYSGNPNATGNIWFKVRDDYYSDNVGQYKVYVAVTTKINSQVSSFLNNLITPITSSLGIASTDIYNSFYSSSSFLKLVRALLLLYIVLLGVQYTLGLSSISAHDLVIRVIKIAIVVQLFSPSSWSFFYNYFFTFFDKGSEFLISAATGDTTTNKINIFSFVDDAFNIFFQQTTWIKASALIFDLVGIIAFFTLIYVMIMYLFILAKVLISYLLAVIALAILFAIAPLFIVMILFERTKKYFDGWVNHLVDYALQSVILFVAFYLVSTIFINMWLGLMNFRVCWGGIDMHPLSINLSAISPYLPNIPLGCFLWFKIISGESFFGVLCQALALVIMVSVIEGIIGHVSAITSAITGAAASGGVDKVTAGIESDAKNFAKDAATFTAKAVVSKAMQIGGYLGGSSGGSGSSGASVSTAKRPGVGKSGSI